MKLRNLAPFVFACILAAVFLAALNGSARVAASPLGTTWYVSTTGNDANDCLTPATACATIAGAVAKAADGDQVSVAAGTYTEHDVEVYTALTIAGAGAEDTIVDGGAAGRVFRVGATVTLADMTIRNGQTGAGGLFVAGGGGVLSSGSLTLSDVILIDNHAAGSGGAILNTGNLTLENTRVLSNTAEGLGGGIYNYSAGVITATQSTLAFNVATGYDGGGAIYAGGAGLTLHDTVVAENRGGTLGGGLTLNLNNQAVLENVTLTGNEAVSGGALFATKGVITATNVTVSGNNATNNYGGIYVSGAEVSLTLQNSTIAYNTRTSTSGNGFNGLAYGNDASVALVNTLLAHNQENNCISTPPTSLGHNLSSDYSCTLNQSGDLQGVEPLLGGLADNGGFAATHTLLPGSPAIDAGDDAQCPAYDARGIARPYDGDGDNDPVCDIGAVEARHQVVIADSTVLEGDSGTVTAVFTVTLAPTSTVAIDVQYATVDETATGGVDYTPVADTLTFAPGETEKTIAVAVTGDTEDELDETFRLELTTSAAIDLTDAQAVGLIVDDDGLPALSISDAALLEGNSGSEAMQFTVQLSPASASVVTVQYATADGSAQAGLDYTAVANTLTFQPGETSKTITVNVLGDGIDEGLSEDFSVALTNPTNTALADADAVGTITDDDEARLTQTLGPQVLEGDSGLTPAVFTIELSTPAAFTITVDFEVTSGYGNTGAVSGVDFVPISGTLTFLPGVTSQTFAVQVIGDTEGEVDEIFWTLISNANAPISANASDGWILNDDDWRLYLPLVVRQ